MASALINLWLATLLFWKKKCHMQSSKKKLSRTWEDYVEFPVANFYCVNFSKMAQQQNKSCY